MIDAQPTNIKVKPACLLGINRLTQLEKRKRAPKTAPRLNICSAG